MTRPSLTHTHTHVGTCAPNRLLERACASMITKRHGNMQRTRLTVRCGPVEGRGRFSLQKTSCLVKAVVCESSSAVPRFWYEPKAQEKSRHQIISVLMPKGQSQGCGEIMGHIWDALSCWRQRLLSLYPAQFACVQVIEEGHAVKLGHRARSKGV